MSAAPEAFGPRLQQLLERQVDRLLRMDTRYPGMFSGIKGKVIALEVIDLERTLFVIATDTGLQLRSGEDVREDVRIRGTAAALFAYALARDARPSARLELQGDVSLAQDFQQLLAGVDPDWEEALSRWTGDIAARKLGNLGRSLMRQARTAFPSLAQDTSEYLRYEARMLPLPWEVRQLSSAAETLRDDAERLRLRLERAERRLRGN